MKRRIYVTLGATPVIGFPLAFVLFIVAIWTNGDRVAGTAALIAVASCLSLVAFGIWTDIGDVPERLPSRAVRKQLRAERDRIGLDRAIRQMEREAGIQ